MTADPLAHFLHNPKARATGWIGVLTSNFIAGWASRLEGPHVTLTIRVNGVVRAKVSPWLSRPDVEKAGQLEISGYYHAFEPRLRHGDIVEAVDETGRHLHGSPKTYTVGKIAPEEDFFKNRSAVAASYISGSGVEIGAFTQPTDLSPDVNVKYYDKYPPEKVREFYVESWGRPLCVPHYWGDAQFLNGLPEEPMDFIIANHVIEHLEDPIMFLKSVAKHLTSGGRALIAAPDKRVSFDRNRPLTTNRHLFDDHEKGAQYSRDEHYAEWAHLVDGLVDDQARKRARELNEQDYSIHFHVWTPMSFVNFITQACAAFNIPLELIFMNQTPGEVVVILQRH